MCVAEDLFTDDYLASIDIKALERFIKSDERWEVSITFMDIIWPEPDTGEVIAWGAQRAHPG